MQAQTAALTPRSSPAYASAASIGSPVSSISDALPGPTTRVRSWVAPEPPCQPFRISAEQNGGARGTGSPSPARGSG